MPRPQLKESAAHKVKYVTSRSCERAAPHEGQSQARPESRQLEAARPRCGNRQEERGSSESPKCFQTDLGLLGAEERSGLHAMLRILTVSDGMLGCVRSEAFQPICTQCRWAKIVKNTVCMDETWLRRLAIGWRA